MPHCSAPVISIDGVIVTRVCTHCGHTTPWGTGVCVHIRQVSLAAHCARGDEIILGHGQHIFKYEGGGASAFLGVSYATIPNQPDGTMKLDDILSAVRPDDPHYPRTAVVCLENTHNSCGGRVLPVDYIDAVGNLCKEHKLACHIDGTVLHRLNQTLLGQSWPHSYVHVVDVDNECFGTAKNAPNTD